MRTSIKTINVYNKVVVLYNNYYQLKVGGNNYGKENRVSI